MDVKPAYQDKRGEWVYPQVYYDDHKQISKKRLLQRIHDNPLVQEAIQVNPCIGQLIEQAKRQRCVYGYVANDTFYNYYKPRIVDLVGFDSSHKELRTMKHYDAVYDAIYDLLPGDEYDLYEGGIMSNGMFSPRMQDRYRREYP